MNIGINIIVQNIRYLKKKVNFTLLQTKSSMGKSFDEDITYLWESFLSGDDNSFSSIYELFIEQLISYGYKLCTDTDIVHDCIQEIFIDLFLKRKKINVNIKNLKAYLFVALRNALIKKIKANKRIKFIDHTDQQFVLNFEIEYSYQDQIIEEEASNELKETLKLAILKIPPKQKEIIYLKFEAEMNYTEISQIMDITVESARKLLYRALLSLRSEIHSNLPAPLFFIFFRKFF